MHVKSILEYFKSFKIESNFEKTKYKLLFSQNAGCTTLWEKRSWLRNRISDSGLYMCTRAVSKEMSYF